MIEVAEIEDDKDGLIEDILTVLDEQATASGHPFTVNSLQLRAADGRGEFLGGLVGQEMMGWLFVQYLGVRKSGRGQGVGGALLARAEAIGQGRGLAGVYLDTFAFQAPDFYLGHGYREIGHLPAVGGAPARIWFCKAFEKVGQ